MACRARGAQVADTRRHHAGRSLHDVRRLPGPGRSDAARCARGREPPCPCSTDETLGLGGHLPQRKVAAACEVMRLAEVTHQRPDWNIPGIETQGEWQPVIEEVVHRTPFATLLRFRKGRRRQPAARADRRADVGPLRDAAARHRAHDAARPRRLHHRLAQRPRRAGDRGPLRAGRVHRAPDRLPRPPGSGLAPHGHLPALRGRAGGRGADVGGRAPGHACEPDADGRPDRLPHQPDRGEQAGHDQADRVVREEPDQHRAVALPRRRPAGVSRLRPAHGVHEHEP